jgi:hypothetical protein
MASKCRCRYALLRFDRVTLFVLLGLLPLFAVAHDAAISDDPEGIINRRFVFGVGAAVNRFDTNLKFTNKATGRSIFVDGEQSLGLPETAVSPMLYGAWRINNKHGLGFSYFRVNRVGTTLEVDKNLGDLNITGEVTVADKSKFFYANYSYTFAEKPDSRVRGILGIYALDLNLGLEGNGVIEVGGAPVSSGQFAEEANLLIPLPVLGIDFFFAVTPKWALGSRFAMIGGNYKDTSALVFDARIQARYQMTPHVALMLGVNYFNGDIDINDDDERQEIRYGYDGFALGLDFNW